MEKLKRNWFLIVLLIFIATAILENYNIFFINKNYKFNVETECDPAVTKCFIRDCSQEGDCPDNNLSEYREFEILARDFDKCTDSSCLKECLTNTINCQEIKCGDSPEDSCSTEGSSE